MTARELINAITKSSFDAKNGLDTNVIIFTPVNYCETISSVNIYDTSKDADGSDEYMAISCD